MSLVEKVKLAVEVQMDDLASRVESDLISATKSAIENKYGESTGAAVGSISTEKYSPTRYFIGAHANFGDWRDGGMHLYYLDQGNKGNGSDGRIHPTRAKALKFKNGTLHSSAGTYGGKGFIAEVASRYR